MALVVDKADLIIEELFKGLLQSSTTQYLALFGGATLAYIGGKFVLEFLNGLRIHFLSYFFPLNFKEQFGDWAVVTGCTSGIGRALAIELAEKGLNIALVARNPKILEELSEYLETTYQIQTLIIVADFKDSGIYTNIREKLEPIKESIGMLFNNVGMADDPKYFSEITESLIPDMINTNISSVSNMSKIAMESMEKRGRGAIINVASIAGVLPVPMMALYSSTKGFMKHFSLNIYHECKSKGIMVQNLVPMGIRTKMLKDIALDDTEMYDNFMTPTAETYAKSALRTLGRTQETTGYWKHSILQWMIGLLPINTLASIIHKITQRRLEARKKKSQ